jgi:hypothetical protein
VRTAASLAVVLLLVALADPAVAAADGPVRPLLPPTDAAPPPARPSHSRVYGVPIQAPIFKSRARHRNAPHPATTPRASAS